VKGWIFLNTLRRPAGHSLTAAEFGIGGVRTGKKEGTLLKRRTMSNSTSLGGEPFDVGKERGSRKRRMGLRRGEGYSRGGDPYEIALSLPVR